MKGRRWRSWFSLKSLLPQHFDSQWSISSSSIEKLFHFTINYQNVYCIRKWCCQNTKNTSFLRNFPFLGFNPPRIVLIMKNCINHARETGWNSMTMCLWYFENIWKPECWVSTQYCNILITCTFELQIWNMNPTWTKIDVCNMILNCVLNFKVVNY